MHLSLATLPLTSILPQAFPKLADCSLLSAHVPVPPPAFSPLPRQLHRNSDKGTGDAVRDSLERKEWFPWAARVE